MTAITPRGIVTISFSTGENIQTWNSFNMTESFIEPLGSITFNVTPHASQLGKHVKLLRKGELVGVKVHGRPVATPVIETVTTSIDRKGGVSIQIECKSVLVNAMTGSVDASVGKTSSAETPVSTLVLEALKPYGFVSIEVDSSADVAALSGKPVDGRAAPVVLGEMKEKDLHAKENETAYGFCSRIFSRLGAALRVRHDGVLLLSKPDYEQQAAYRIIEGKVTNVIGNRALSVKIKDTNNGQFSEVVVRGKTSKTSRGSKRTSEPVGPVISPAIHFAMDAIVPGIAGSIDNLINRSKSASSGSDTGGVGAVIPAPLVKVGTTSVRPESAPYSELSFVEGETGRHTFRGGTGGHYRPKFVTDKSATSIDRAKAKARNIMSARSTAAYQLTVTVDGFLSRTNRVWAVDTICSFKSQSLGIDEDFWVMSRTFTRNRGDSDKTTLVLVPKHSVVLS